MGYTWNDDTVQYVKKTIINYNHDTDGNFNQMTLTCTVDVDIPNSTQSAQTLYNGIINSVETFLTTNTDYDAPVKYTYQVLTTTS